MTEKPPRQSVNGIKRQIDPYAADQEARKRWARARTDALSRARYRCEVIGCGITGAINLTVHHIISRLQAGGDYPENLIVLCPAHHDEAELLGLRDRSLIRNLVSATREAAQPAEKFMGDQRPRWRRLPPPDIDGPPREEGPRNDALPLLRKAINRLRGSGRTWLEVSTFLGFKSAAAAYLIKTGGWIPTKSKAEEIMRDLPRELWHTTKELQSAILVHIKTERIGIRNAVKSRYLARQFCTTDRMVRAAINELRNEGHPICSSVGKSSGFYWPTSMSEYKEFRHRDYNSRIRKMLKTLNMMDMGAEAMFEGKPLPVIQPELIGT